MLLSDAYKNRLDELCGLLNENRIEKLKLQKYPNNIIDFAYKFAQATTKDPSKEELVLKNHYIPWIAEQAKKNPEIINDKVRLDTIINWIKHSGYNSINSSKNFEEVYENAKEWLTKNNIDSLTGQRVEGGKIIKKYPNGLQWIRVTDANWCITIGEFYGWCFNDQNRAERFIGLGKIGQGMEGYMLMSDKYTPLIAVQYNNQDKIIEDIQGTYNTQLDAKLLGYAFDLFAMLPEIKRVKGHIDTFWKSLSATPELKLRFLEIPSVKLSVEEKHYRDIPFNDEDIANTPIADKLVFHIPLNKNEISKLTIQQKIRYNYITKKEIDKLDTITKLENGYEATKEELDKLPAATKIEYEIPLNKKQLQDVGESLIKKVRRILKGVNPNDLFIPNSFEQSGFNKYEIDKDGIKITMDEKEYDEYYSGLDEYEKQYKDIVEYYDYTEEVDDTELDYIQNYISDSNERKLQEFALRLGVSNYDFTNDASVVNFIDNYFGKNHETENMFSTYLYNYGNALAHAKKKSVEKELEEEQKFKYKDGFLVLPWKELYNFLKKNQQVELKNLRSANINGYIKLENAFSDYKISDSDIVDINNDLGHSLKKLEDKLDESGTDYSGNVTEGKRILNDLGFEPSSGKAKSGKGFSDYEKYNLVLDKEKRKIFIISIDYFKKKFDVIIHDYAVRAKKDALPKRILKGEVPFDRLADYAQQYELFKEDMDLRKVIQKELLSIDEDFRYLYDKNQFVPTDDVIGVAQNAINITAQNNLVNKSGSNEGSGTGKAKSIVSKEPMSHSQLKRMKAFFDNNYQSVQAERAAGRNINNSGILQSWDLWGGDAGRNWVEKNIGAVNSSNKTSKKIRNPEDGIRTKTMMDPNNTRIHSESYIKEETVSNVEHTIEEFYKALKSIESFVRAINILTGDEHNKPYLILTKDGGIVKMIFNRYDGKFLIIDLIDTTEEAIMLTNAFENFEGEKFYKFDSKFYQSKSPKNAKAVFDAFVNMIKLNDVQEEAYIGPDGLKDIEFDSEETDNDDEFTKLMKKWNVEDGRIIGPIGKEYWFPIEAQEDLDSLGINWYEKMKVSNKEHPDFNKSFLVFVYNPKHID